MSAKNTDQYLKNLPSVLKFRRRKEEKKEVKVARRESIHMAVEKITDLKKTDFQIKATKLMSEQEVTVSPQESKKWEKKIEAFTRINKFSC